MKKLLADFQLAPSQLEGFGPLGQSGANAGTQFNDTLSKIIGVMTVVAFIWFTFQIVLGAIRIVSSGGDKGAIEGARKQITTGIVGVIIVVAALFLVSLLGAILGFNSILNPACILSTTGC